MTLLNFQRPKESIFKASKNEEKELEMINDLTRDELAHMAKRIKRAMRLTKKTNKDQESGKRKSTNKFSKENYKGTSKDKKIKCSNYGGLRHFATNCPSSNPKDMKIPCMLLGVTQILKKVTPWLLKMQSMIKMTF